ncbi:alpha/beta hydrolase [Hasllibacter sp. MH4015]|uniref:alpha/beta hydrolase n=1 Tax=Hasllibacter sp. MH4015 TaxID=2854029 RepID=UPI001CD7E626|nr:alpha/beta hydrolase [Hasllibacter sp. MH4015]
MARAPYPGLHPDLWDIVRGIEDAFPEPQDTLPVATFRKRLEEMAAKSPMVPPPGLTTRDWHLTIAGRDVRLRAYLPDNAGSDALLYMHGGGWMLGSIKGHDQVCADLAHGTGLRVVSIDYALSPEHRYPVALDECIAAFEVIAGGQSPLGPVRNTWLGGDSAGGNLALGTALRLRDHNGPVPAGLFLVYPCTDPACAFPSYEAQADAPFLSTALMHRFWREYLGGQEPDIYAAPARADMAGLPQTIMLNATLDPLIDEGDDLARLLRDAHVPLDYIRAEGLIHGLLRFRHSAPAAQAAFQAALDAIRARL